MALCFYSYKIFQLNILCRNPISFLRQDKEDNEKESLAVKAISEGDIQTDVAKKLVKEFTDASQTSCK